MNGSTKWLMAIIGIVGLLLTMYSQFQVPLANAINQEIKCRQEGDDQTRKEISEKLDKIIEQNAQQAVTIAELKSDMRYIKKNAQ